jgi:FkbM family methyltransferase
MNKVTPNSASPGKTPPNAVIDPTLRTAGGLEFEPAPDEEIISTAIRETGSYEPEILAAMHLFLRRGDTFVDVGANFGWHSAHASRIVGPHGNVLAFEPVPEIADLLARNCERNRCANVKIHRIALGAQQGEVKLALNSANPGGARIAEHGTLPVHMFALDQVIADAHPAMIKIDVEGHELEVLRGAHQALEKEPVLVVEYNSGRNRRRLYRFLTQRGYRLYIVSGALDFMWMRMPFVASDFENVVAVPKRLSHVVSPATALDYPHLLFWLRYGTPRSIALWVLRTLGLRRR